MFWLSVAMFWKRPMRKRAMNSLPRPNLTLVVWTVAVTLPSARGSWVGLGWQGVYKRSHAAPWNKFWSGCRPVRTSSEVQVSELAGGSGPGMDVWSQPGGGLTAPHRWPDLGFLHAGYAPATCWAGLFGRLRPGGKLRPPGINPLITVMVGNCDRNLWPHFFGCTYDIDCPIITM